MTTFSIASFVIGLMTSVYAHMDDHGCCDQKLMDANQQVVIETGRTLTPGVYRAACARVCTTDELLIQVWTPINGQTYRLKWQISYRPSTADVFRDYVMITFPANNGLTVATNDRIGLFGSALHSPLGKLNIPYSTNGSSSVQLSRQSFNDSVSPFVTGSLQVTVQDVSWQRTFASFLRFSTAGDCSDVFRGTSALTTTRRPPRDLPHCGCTSSCSPDAVLRKPIDKQKTIIDSMELEITRMSELIRSMQSSQVQTGFCPDDSLPGLYGIGSCYIVYRRSLQLAEAAVRCSADHGANLVAIESEIEQQFIYNIITNNGSRAVGGETFWTSGMYSVLTKQWMWYRQDWTPRQPIASNTFRGWRNNAEPRPYSQLDACLVIDVGADNIYWRNHICISQKFYICEIPKICY